MATPQINLQLHLRKPTRFLSPNQSPNLAPISTLQFRNSHRPSNLRYTKCSSLLPESVSVHDSSLPHLPRNRGSEEFDTRTGFSESLKSWVSSVRSVLPGGIWWVLTDSEEDGSKTVKPITVLVVLRRIWALVADDRLVVYIALGSLTIAAISEISIPNLIAASVFCAQRGDTAVFYRNSKLLLLLCVTSGVFSGIRSGCFGVANKILLKRLRETLYSALILQDTSFFDTEAVGDLTSRLGADCQRLSRVIGNDIHLILRFFLQGAGALISLMCLSWPLALSTLVICAALSAIFVVYGQFRKKAAKLTQEYSASTNEVARETLSLMRIVRAYGTEEKEYERYEQWLNKLASVNIRESIAFGLWNLSFIGLYRSTQVFAVALGGLYILSGNISAEQLMKYVLYCEWLIYAAWRLEDNISSLLQSVGASEKVFHLMALLPSDQFLTKGIKLPRLVGKVDFVNVSFYYPSRSTVPALEHVNISVQPNEVVAIVGHSGGGKSTLVNLLLRLYESTDGQIYFDDFPLQDLDVGWLRERIGFVGQEPHLFHMDIKSNICYGCSREITQEDVEWAAKQAHIHEFISSLPNSYETIVHDGLLSGGQKQRLAIARAIVRDPTLLILDEATSALDAENEYHITRVLHAFRNDSRAKRTVIIIAHRLSTVRAADKVIVMDSGRVVEVGNHTELIHQSGHYARLVRTNGNVLD